MKLRNKKTGEILETVRTAMVCKNKFRIYDELTDKYYSYNSLAELNAEWEDAPEEPKKHYEILGIGVVIEQKDSEDEIFRNQNQREIGNYFETKEEAELVVRKLKAWKRLKDKGFEIEGWDNTIGDDYYKTGQIVLNLNNVRNREWDEYEQIKEIKNDLDLLFRGEE